MAKIKKTRPMKLWAIVQQDGSFAGDETGLMAFKSKSDALCQCIEERGEKVIAAVIMPRSMERRGPVLCPHGNKAGSCNACDIQSDFAFDAARENRIFGR
jgi:hypothetical protein